LKKKLRGQCPCGHVFDTFNDEQTAIVEVRLHFEQFHKDFLPFGITNAEALALLKEVRVLGKQKVSSSNFSSLKRNSPIAQEMT
jgi:hypothetical protein